MLRVPVTKMGFLARFRGVTPPSFAITREPNPSLLRVSTHHTFRPTGTLTTTPINSDASICGVEGSAKVANHKNYTFGRVLGATVIPSCLPITHSANQVPARASIHPAPRPVDARTPPINTEASICDPSTSTQQNPHASATHFWGETAPRNLIPDSDAIDPSIPKEQSRSHYLLALATGKTVFMSLDIEHTGDYVRVIQISVDLFCLQLVPKGSGARPNTAQSIKDCCARSTSMSNWTATSNGIPCLCRCMVSLPATRISPVPIPSVSSGLSCATGLDPILPRTSPSFSLHGMGTAAI